MKLGSLRSKSLDGDLCVVSRDLQRARKVTHISPNLREAVENWDKVSPLLEAVYKDLNSTTVSDFFKVIEADFLSALPRTFLFADGSAFIHHIKLVRMARKADLPETLKTVPLMYQGESGTFHAPLDPIPQVDFSHGTDFEGEVCVITDRVEIGTTPDEALKKIRLLVLINDVSLRGLIPAELAQGFGFFVSKPTSALSPFAITPDELGESWHGGRVHLDLNVNYNGQFFGKANAGEMHFHFGELVAHAAQTRTLAAASLIGSGTVSNEDMSRGSSCLAEKRMLEQIHNGKIETPFMKVGDTVEIFMNDKNGQSLFGRIFQKVIEYRKKL